VSFDLIFDGFCELLKQGSCLKMNQLSVFSFVYIVVQAMLACPGFQVFPWNMNLFVFLPTQESFVLCLISEQKILLD
jgi:hypothetical protein